MKRLLITSTDLMMIQFLVPHVLYLREQGYDVEVACSNVGGRLDEVKEKLGTDSVHQVRLARSPANLNNLQGLSELKKLIKTNHYNLIWTNEPVMSIMTRLAAKKARRKGTKVLYMTHGYHFFKGCPAKLKVFYPIEKYASRLCDCIVTVSWEDYYTTKEKFKVSKVFHINGIGLDTEKFVKPIRRNEKRSELGIPENVFLLLSVGELKPHKNHKVIIEALSQINADNVFYAICGKGELLYYLKKLANDVGLQEKVKFLGYRQDINEIMGCADAFAFPSVREGLGLASLEAMSAGLPVIGTDTRGIRDYVIDGETGYLIQPNDVKSTVEAINKVLTTNFLDEISRKCVAKSREYDIRIIRKDIMRIIRETIGESDE